MEDREESGMDTTYVGIMLVVFLVIAALAIDIGYLYVSEDDLKAAAETSALAGAQTLKQQIQAIAKSDPARLDDVVNDKVQSLARSTAIEKVSGKHGAAALIEIANNNTNRLTTGNDITVGFWDMESRTYTPDEKPVNAIQVRTRRTAESENAGLGSLGSILAKISGPQKFNYTPDAIASFPARADVNFALCTAACDEGCAYPNICTVPERRMIHGPWNPAGDSSMRDRYAYTTLLYNVTTTTKLSDLICMDLPPQEVCGKQIFTLQDADKSALRDLESTMYNPNVDAGNKEFDPSTGNVVGWWVMAPVTDCAPVRQEDSSERRTVTKYALTRIRRICVDGPSGCQQNGTAFKAPSAQCGETGIYIDRISCISCADRATLQFTGLHPVLVGETAPAQQ